MGKDVVVYQRPASDQLHPLVYKAAAGLVLCFVASAWVFFDRQNDAGLPLAIASCLLFVAVLLPLVLWRVWRREQDVQADGDGSSFRHWARGEFSACESRLKASHAALDALLPIAAVAGGLTALGIVFALIAATS
jgi:hypothetical protein